MKSTLFAHMSLLTTLALAACAGAEQGEPPPESAQPVRSATAAPEVESEPTPSAAEAPAESAAGTGAPQPAGGVDAPAPAGSTPAPAPATEAGTPVAPAADQQGSAEGILRRAERAYDAIRSMEAEFTQEVTVPLLNSTQRSRGKIYHRRPDRFLMQFTQPEGDVVVADGQYLWMYYPSTDPKQVLRTRIAEGGQQVDLQKEFLSNPTERFRAAHAGTESVAGRPADVLVLTPRSASPYRRVRLWVDREDALVRRFEIIEENESVRRLELRALKPNATLADQLFQFTPPPGAQVFEQ